MLHENTVPSWKDVLQKSRFDFHLTGSRFFDTSHNLSDWDYYVELPDSDSGAMDLYSDLHQAGLAAISKGMYEDLNCQEIWQGSNVHVQIVKNAHAKTVAQAAIKESRLFDVVPGGMFEKEIWNLAYTTILIVVGKDSMLELPR